MGKLSGMQVIYPVLRNLVIGKIPELEAISADEKQAILVYNLHEFEEFGYDYRNDLILCFHDRDYGNLLAYVPFNLSLWNKTNWGENEPTINELFEVGSWDITRVPESFCIVESDEKQLKDLRSFIGRGFLVGIDASDGDVPKIPISEFANQVYENRLKNRSIQWSCPDGRTGLMLLNEALGLFTHYTYGYERVTDDSHTQELSQIEFAYAIDRVLRNARNAQISFVNDDYVLIYDGIEVRWKSKALPYAHSSHAYTFTPDIIVVNGISENRQEWVKSQITLLPDMDLEQPIEDFMTFMLNINCSNLGRLFTPASYSHCDISAKLEKSENGIAFDFEHITTSGTEIALYASTYTNTYDVAIVIPAGRALPGRCHYSLLQKFIADNEKINLSNRAIEVVYNDMVGYVPPLLLDSEQGESTIELAY